MSGRRRRKLSKIMIFPIYMPSVFIFRSENAVRVFNDFMCTILGVNMIRLRIIIDIAYLNSEALEPAGECTPDDHILPTKNTI